MSFGPNVIQIVFLHHDPFCNTCGTVRSSTADATHMLASIVPAHAAIRRTIRITLMDGRGSHNNPSNILINNEPAPDGVQESAITLVSHETLFQNVSAKISDDQRA